MFFNILAHNMPGFCMYYTILSTAKKYKRSEVFW